MSAKYETSVFGHDLIINVPTSVAEYDKLAKKEGACLEAAIDHEVAHGTLGAIRKALCKLFEDEGGEGKGAKRRETATGKFATDKDGKKTEILKKETDLDFFNRIVAEKSLTAEQVAAMIATVADGGAKEVKFDPSTTPRQPAKPPVLAADYINSAKLNLGKLDDAKINKALGKLLPPDKCVFKRTDNVEEDAKTLGWLLRDLELARRKQPTLLA